MTKLPRGLAAEFPRKSFRAWQSDRPGLESWLCHCFLWASYLPLRASGSHLLSRDNTFLKGMLRGLNELMCIMHLAQVGYPISTHRAIAVSLVRPAGMET